MIYIGMDDTDTAESRGTGALARWVAADLATDFRVLGVIRQQLLSDPRVPCTKNNSSKAILLDAGDLVGRDVVAALFERVRSIMLADFQPGSDPGLCVANAVPADVIAFGRRTQDELVTQAEARGLAARHGMLLEGLGGDELGVIGALAAVGLTAGGEHGRYIEMGGLRALTGLVPVADLLTAGIAAVLTAEGQPIESGVVQADRLRPARRGGVPIAVFERQGDTWAPVRLD